MLGSWISPDELEAKRPITQKLTVKMREPMGSRRLPLSLTIVEFLLLLISGISSSSS